MGNSAPRLPGSRKKTFPMTLRIICAVVLCAVLAVVGRHPST